MASGLDARRRWRAVRANPTEPFARALELVGLAHFRLHVFRHGLVERGLDLGERVVDRVGLPLGEERRAVELDELLLDHAAHQVRCVDLVDAVAELPVEAVGVEQRQEELEVLLLAVVRRRRHQEQVACVLAQAFREPEASRLFELRAEVVGRELVGLVEDGQVPSGVAELLLELLVPRHLVETNDELMVVVERVPARRGRLQQRGVDAEFEPELLEELVSPLLDETSRGDDQDAASVGPHDEFADVEPRHDGLPGPRVVRQDEPQGLPGKHRLVDGGDLVRERLHVRRVHRHHRVEEEREVDALGFARQLEGSTVPVEGPRAFDSRDA